MAVNKLTFTINSRQYTVVAEESVEYLERLCNHINEKVESVLQGGQNVMGERPVVLAALNVCDEYFKALKAENEAHEQMQKLNEKNAQLQQIIRDLKNDISDASSGQVSIDETAMRAEVKAAHDELEDANSKIKFLESHIKGLENKLAEFNGKNNQNRNINGNNANSNNSYNTARKNR